MKKYIAIMCLALLALSAKGQSYAALWKQVSDAREKDLPRTEQTILRKITQKAEKEKNYGDLLAAEVGYVNAVGKVSPDSIPAEVTRVALRAKAKEGRNELLTAVYSLVLSKLYASTDTAKAAQYRRKAMANPALLARHKYQEYLPLVTQGEDDAIFNNDLLHVIGFETGDYKTLDEYYTRVGNRPAACISAARRYDFGKISKEQADSLLSRYADLPECGEIAYRYYRDRISRQSLANRYDFLNASIAKWQTWKGVGRLKEMLFDLTQPMFQLQETAQRGFAGKENKLCFEVRNLKNLKITLLKTNLTGEDAPLNSSSEYVIKGSEQTILRSYPDHLPYETFADTIALPKLSPGVYVIKASSDSYEIDSSSQFYYVSNLFLLAEGQPGKSIRYVTVDALTGQPVANASIKLYTYDNDFLVTLTTNAKGEAAYTYQENKKPGRAYVTTATDKALPRNEMYAYYSAFGYEKEHLASEVVTDRAIYRPGQVVHSTVIVYNIDNVSKLRKAAEGRQLTLTLLDANRKEVAKKTLRTDEFGTATADFVLPKTGMTGTFTLQTSEDINGYQTIKVEEYKRPTFDITINDYRKAYAPGDTIQVSGVVKTFSGAPFSGKTVKYTVTRRTAKYWLSWRNSFGEPIHKGTATIGKNGDFIVSIPLVVPKNEAQNLASQGKWLANGYVFRLSVTATDGAGESQSSEDYFYTGNKRAFLSCKVADKYRSDADKIVRFRFLNPSGTAVDADVKYIIVPYAKGNKQPSYVGKYATAKANEDVKIDIRKSGSYRLHAVCGTDTVDNDFIVFSLSDKKPVAKTSDWFYISGSQFPKDGSPIYVQVGSSDENQHVVYSIYSGNKLIEQGAFNQSNTITTRKFTYQPDYGDGIVLNYAWVRDEKVYVHTEKIARPMPDDVLKLSWKTFRNKLLPGQKEEWTLTIKDAKGKPATAQMLALMYDKSLDKFARYYKPYFNTPSIALPNVAWEAFRVPNLWLYDAASRPEVHYSSYLFAGLSEELSTWCSAGYYNMPYGDIATNSLMTVKAESVKTRSMRKEAPRMMKAAAASLGSEEAPLEEEKAPANHSFRENLNETAFFYPRLLADKDGNIAIRFTLPESLTTWHFVGLAHDKSMKSGAIEEDVVAQKQLMIQPNMPRFVREGDEARIECRVSNLSGKAMNLAAKMQIVDPQTDSVIQTLTHTLTIPAGETAKTGFTFGRNTLDVWAKQHEASASFLVLRFLAEGNGFSDGEQHYLPILPNKELVTKTYPITFNQKGSETVNLHALTQGNGTGKTRLTVEYTDNPSWLVVQALPYISHPEEDNAFSLVAAYYANALGKAVVNQLPRLKTTLELWKRDQGNSTSLQSNLAKNEELKQLLLSETPWIQTAETEQELKEKLIGFYDENALENNKTEILAKLKDLQDKGGAFAWHKGMTENVYATTFILKTLVRLQVKLGQGMFDNPATADMMKKAFAFLDSHVAHEVKDMKAWEKDNKRPFLPGAEFSEYLYINALAKRKQTADMAYLLSRLERESSSLSIFDKANMAVVMARYGKSNTARLHLKSLKEYAVSTPEMGKYFDTRKAFYSWRSYQIPTEVAALEALQLLSPEDSDIPQMQKWLLQQKRTQLWDTPINTLDAVWAFSNGNNGAYAEATEPDILLDNDSVDLPKATAGLGYIKVSEDLKTLPQELTINKKSEGMSFGGVYLQYPAEAKNLNDSENGFGLKRELMGENNQPLNLNELKVGDKVKVKITIKADRDYDFVEITDKRPACLEPASQATGYYYGYLYAPRDNKTNYYFNKMPKGIHVIETEYYVDRAGVYSSGTCVSQSAYAPEFSGTSAIYTLKVNE